MVEFCEEEGEAVWLPVQRLEGGWDPKDQCRVIFPPASVAEQL